MTIADLCLPLMLLLTIGAVAPAKVAGRREYDNARPRDPRFYADGFRQRSLWAHQNSYESLPFFFAAVILAEMRGMPQGTVDVLAVGFVVARAGYIAAYMADRPTLRSAVWAVALACNLALFFLPAFAHG
ncbi:MAG: MAPEG family protein [Acetobacteraceae bacterium]